jgi:hypothetical protein
VRWGGLGGGGSNLRAFMMAIGDRFACCAIEP